MILEDSKYHYNSLLWKLYYIPLYVLVEALKTHNVEMTLLKIYIYPLIIYANKKFIYLLSSETDDMKRSDWNALHFDCFEQCSNFVVVFYYSSYVWRYTTAHNNVL